MHRYIHAQAFKHVRTHSPFMNFRSCSSLIHAHSPAFQHCMLTKAGNEPVDKVCSKTCMYKIILLSLKFPTMQSLFTLSLTTLLLSFFPLLSHPSCPFPSLSLPPYHTLAHTPTFLAASSCSLRSSMALECFCLMEATVASWLAVSSSRVFLNWANSFSL